MSQQVQDLLSACLHHILFPPHQVPRGELPTVPRRNTALGPLITHWVATAPAQRIKITNQNYSPVNSVMKNIQHSIIHSCSVLSEFPVQVLETWPAILWDAKGCGAALTFLPLRTTLYFLIQEAFLHAKCWEVYLLLTSCCMKYEI